MEEGRKYDFPVITDDGVDVGLGPEEAEPGRRVLRDETIYEATGDDGWVPGEELGTVHIEQLATSRPGRKLFSATFVFDDGEIVRLEGVVPGGNWQGKGKAGYAGGTGKFGDRRGDIPVESRNPKRWG